MNRICLKNLVYIGSRSIDPYERLVAKKLNIHLYGMRVSRKMMKLQSSLFIADKIVSKNHKTLDAINRSSASGRQCKRQMNWACSFHHIEKCVENYAGTINRLLFYKMKTNVDCIYLLYRRVSHTEIGRVRNPFISLNHSMHRKLINLACKKLSKWQWRTSTRSKIVIITLASILMHWIVQRHPVPVTHVRNCFSFIYFFASIFQLAT